VFPDRAVALATLIQDSMLSSRAKNNFSRTSLLTLGDVMKYNNNEISVFAGIGFNTLAEIIGRLKTYYGLHLTIFGAYITRTKNAKKAANQKPSSDDLVE
jgi:DNA-directed RNA polymerase alpha subunit